MLLDIINVNGVPVLELTGSPLEKAGFESGDIVSVSFSNNQIVISKNKKTIALSDMEKKNPSIKRLIKDFNLDLLTGT